MKIEGENDEEVHGANVEEEEEGDTSKNFKGELFSTEFLHCVNM